MVGGSYFAGAPWAGTPAIAVPAALTGTATVSVASTLPFLQLPAPLAAAAVLTLSTIVSFAAPAAALGATAGLAVSAAATTLQLPAPLAATAGLSVESAGGLLVPAPPAALAGTATLTLGTAAGLVPPLLPPHPTYPAGITIGGIDVTGRVRVRGLSIRDVLNDAPNTARLTIEGEAPAVGQAIRITLDVAPPRVLFAGTIQTVDQTYELLPAHRAWALTAIDDTGRANARRPFGTWIPAYSATTIAQWLITTYAPAFSPAGIEANLPLVTIVFDGADPFIACLARLASTIGGYCKIEDNVVYLFQTDASDPPDPVDDAHPPLDSPPITVNTDSSQLRTRVYGKGYGESIQSDVTVGETLVPIEDGVLFPPLGGRLIAGATSDGAQSEQLTYAQTEPRKGGSLVGPGAAPGTGPVVTPTGGSGVESGAHDYALVYVTGTDPYGATLPSPRTTVTLGTHPAPGTAPTFAFPEVGTGPDEGYHEYSVSFVTAYGETVGGPISAAVATSAAVGQLPPAPHPTPSAAIPGTGPDPGTHDYALTYVNAQGETTAASVSPTVTTSASGGELPRPGRVSAGWDADPGRWRPGWVLYLWRHVPECERGNHARAVVAERHYRGAKTRGPNQSGLTAQQCRGEYPTGRPAAT